MPLEDGMSNLDLGRPQTQMTRGKKGNAVERKKLGLEAKPRFHQKELCLFVTVYRLEKRGITPYC